MSGVKTIRPIPEFFGEWEVPADKSVVQRALMLASVAEGESFIRARDLGEDCLTAENCMRALGVDIRRGNDGIFVVGTKKFADGKTLDCGNSATCMRLLTGLLAGRGTHAILTGDNSLCARPMRRVIEPLKSLGADISSKDGYAPLTVLPRVLQGGEVLLTISSAQVKSAVLMAGLFAKGKTCVVETVPTRDHTERLISYMGGRLSKNGNAICVEQSPLFSREIDVAGDISSAAYLLALGVLKGGATVKEVGVNPGRTGFLSVLERMGAKVERRNERTLSGEPRADIFIRQAPLRAVNIGGEEVPSLIDELPLIAILSAFADGESVLTGASELRVKECDRIRATCALIRALGGRAEEYADGWKIFGGSLVGGKVKADVICGDHRMALTAAIGLLASEQGGELQGGEIASVSFPNFFKKLQTMGVCI